MAKVKNRNERRIAFAELRAGGLTIKAAAERVGISERLGKKWARELECEVANIAQARQASIYNKYGLKRDQRIERLAKVTDKLLQAVERIDVERLADEKPEKALELLLKFIEAVARDEHTERIETELKTPQGALFAIDALYKRVVNGEASKAQAETELKVILAAFTGIDATQTAEKIEALERALNEFEAEARQN